MKRRLFFWIDKLQIKRSERIVLSVLMLMTLIFSAALLGFDFSPSPDDYEYAELEKVFREKSEIQQAKKSAIMARYSVENSESNTGLGENVQKNVKTYGISEPAGESADTTRINVNKATADELQKLPGIGPAYASRIVEWRKKHGNFETVDQLLEIRGIGPKRLEKIKPLVIL